MLNTYKEISRRRIFILVGCYLQIFLYIFRKNSYLQKLKNFLLFQLNQIIEVSSLEELFQNVVFPFLFIVDVYFSGLQKGNTDTCDSSLNAVRNGNHSITNEDESRQLTAHNEQQQSARNNGENEGKTLGPNYNKLKL